MDFLWGKVTEKSRITQNSFGVIAYCGISKGILDRLGNNFVVSRFPQGLNHF